MELRKKKRAFSNSTFDFRDLIKRCVLFSVIFLFFSVIITLLMSFALFRIKDNTSAIEIGGIISLFLSTFITSFIQSRVNKRFYFWGGLILGVFIFILTMCISLILSSGSLTSNGFLVKTLIPAFSVLGAMVGIKSEVKRRKRRR